MGFFEGVGKAFANVGRWGEKQRIALQYGSDWEDRLGREQEFLDQYWAEKQQRDKEDRLRQQADEEEKKLQREEFARKRRYDAANDALGLFEKMQDSGASLADVDPAMLQRLPVPAEGLWTAAAESRGRRDAEARAKAEKAALDLQNIQSQIAHRAWEELPKPEKPEKPEKPMTHNQALANARSQWYAENPPRLGGVREPAPPGWIERRAQEIMAGEGKTSAEVAVAGFDANDALLAALAGAGTPKKGVNPAETGGNPAGNAAANESKAGGLPKIRKVAGMTLYLHADGKYYPEPE